MATAQYDTLAHTAYTCHRAESRAGFKHGDGVRKQRQDWSVGEIVRVGFVSGLQVVAKDPDGSYALVRRDAKGQTARYRFEPHCGLARVE